MNNYKLSPMGYKNKKQGTKPSNTVVGNQATSTKQAVRYFNAHGMPALGRVLKRAEHNLAQ